MKLSKAKNHVTPKSFVDLPALKLHIAVATNDKNQITGFNATYKGKTIESSVESGDIEKAWKRLETFISKTHRT